VRSSSFTLNPKKDISKKRNDIIADIIRLYKNTADTALGIKIYKIIATDSSDK
jgi:hypothetical protein